MNNVKRIQQELRRRGLDGMLVTDEKNQRYASGFPITDGAVVVGLEKSWLITDSRYIEAAEAAVDGSLTEVVLYDREHPLTGIIRSVCAGMARLAAEDKKLSHAGYLGYEKALGRELLPAGDLFETRCRITKARRPFFFAEGSGFVGDKLAVKAEFSFALMEKSNVF